MPAVADSTGIAVLAAPGTSWQANDVGWGDTIPAGESVSLGSFLDLPAPFQSAGVPHIPKRFTLRFRRRTNGVITERMFAISTFLPNGWLQDAFLEPSKLLWIAAKDITWSKNDWRYGSNDQAIAAKLFSSLPAGTYSQWCWSPQTWNRNNGTWLSDPPLIRSTYTTGMEEKIWAAGFWTSDVFAKPLLQQWVESALQSANPAAPADKVSLYGSALLAALRNWNNSASNWMATYGTTTILSKGYVNWMLGNWDKAFTDNSKWLTIPPLFPGPTTPAADVTTTTTPATTTDQVIDTGTAPAAPTAASISTVATTTPAATSPTSSPSMSVLDVSGGGGAGTDDWQSLWGPFSAEGLEQPASGTPGTPSAAPAAATGTAAAALAEMPPDLWTYVILGLAALIGLKILSSH